MGLDRPMPREEGVSAPFDDLDRIKQIDRLGRQIVGVVRAETFAKPETHSVRACVDFGCCVAAM